jgi:hypothetical protein
MMGLHKHGKDPLEAKLRHPAHVVVVALAVVVKE